MNFKFLDMIRNNQAIIYYKPDSFVSENELIWIKRKTFTEYYYADGAAGSDWLKHADAQQSFLFSEKATCQLKIIRLD